MRGCCPTPRRSLEARRDATVLGANPGAPGLYIAIRRSIREPLQGLTPAVTAVGQGNLTRPFDSQRRVEIGTLVREAASMRQRYLGLGRARKSRGGGTSGRACGGMSGLRPAGTVPPRPPSQEPT
ncbi:MAG: methyl-accepting chemotaxis protein [Rhodoferax sp.]|nr:methyl-accepting chemotaxis protein [Rhodoferax sp.]